MLKVGAAALNQTPLDWKGNEANIRAALQAAKAEGVQVLCLPELCISGYGCEDAFYTSSVINRSLDILFRLAPATEGLVACLGLPLRLRNKTYNAAAIVADGKVLGFVLKQHLPNYGVFYEDRWFQRWKTGKIAHFTYGGETYQAGDLVFDFPGLRLGVEICEDAWVPQRPGTKLNEKGVDLILNPSASPFTFGKFKTRERLVTDASRAFSCVYVYSNLLGNESGRLIFDGDTMISSGGNLLASSDRFSYADYTLTTAAVDLDVNRAEQSRIKGEYLENIMSVESPFEPLYTVEETREGPLLEAFERGGYLKEEEFSRAVSLGLFDYLRKSRSFGFTVSLSGGADSSACTALCALMLRLGDESIGLEKLKSKLSYIPGVSTTDNLDQLSELLITTLYQGTRNSSEDTFNSAQALAKDCAAKFYYITVDEVVDAYTGMIAGQMGRTLTWENSDIPLQNIQARVRAPSIWLMANIQNHLLLTTSNRSEAAVGYCTMDGDTAGSIAPISGIDKAWLRQWLVWLEKIGCEVKGKHLRLAGLSYVNSLQPTAELRPKERTQTDEKDLMPYPVLNRLENLGIRDGKSPLECFKILEKTEKYAASDLHHWTKRFFTLWSRNQWKRERYAPGFHLDAYNLDPRSWCRFPILSGSFEVELADLDHYIINR
jgi:NAD+ synthase (glutamine-hydrolysing)